MKGITFVLVVWGLSAVAQDTTTRHLDRMESAPSYSSPENSTDSGESKRRIECVYKDKSGRRYVGEDTDEYYAKQEARRLCRNNSNQPNTCRLSDCW